ncbi:TIGR01244 family sulfur transferase [Methylotenera sp.]|uniref:TIGR01244 family sulfur transferase n=1 Tax=Methylotenera sp. TaxID=2051956 RepID=UPI002488F9F0|nr:TIGR01244 family sulfur transferase [Methylotenera sp.]MDI1299080.1 TIGR01244 family sulfur transferase [Methylotenera sp.]
MTLIINQLNKDFSFTSQIHMDDIGEIAGLGFKTIINNRPDFEGGSEQPTSTEIEAFAKIYGISYAYIPVIPNQITPENIAKFKQAFDDAPKPILGFCRTGNRASTLFHLAST